MTRSTFVYVTGGIRRLAESHLQPQRSPALETGSAVLRGAIPVDGSAHSWKGVTTTKSLVETIRQSQFNYRRFESCVQFGDEAGEAGNAVAVHRCLRTVLRFFDAIAPICCRKGVSATFTRLRRSR